MRSEHDLVAAANQSFVGSYRTLVEHSVGGETRQIGGVFAFVTGLPLSLFNGCLVVGPATTRDLEAASDWIQEQRLPHRIWLAEDFAPGLADVLLARGLRQDPEPYPGMVLHPLPPAPRPATGVTVISVEASRRDEYLRVWVEDGFPEMLADRLFSNAFVADPDVRLFIGRLNEQAVATSVAIRTADVSGVYAVATQAAARRRGVGTAVTWAAVAAGREWGCDAIVLQATPMGLPVYRAMGFRTVVSYSTFVESTPAERPD